MSAAATLAGAAPDVVSDWQSIDWKKVWHNVRRLQARIVKAVQEGRYADDFVITGTSKELLEPVVLAYNNGFSAKELNRIRKIILERLDLIQEAWNEHSG